MDLIKSLFEDLHSPDPSIRFSVLERIDGIDWTEDRIAGFRQAFEGEEDLSARFYMQKILSRITKGAPREEAEGPQKMAILEELLKRPDRDYLALALLLESVSQSEAPLVILSLRESEWQDFPALILPTILKFFGRFGSFEDSRVIESLCRHPDPWVISAAIETLETISPDSLKDLVLPLLDNPVHGIRSRAVRLLYQWDPQEALKQFHDMLSSDDPDDRNAALFNAIFFPFQEIEPFLLKFLSIEDTPSLIEKAGILFRANPMPEEPLRLLEVKDASRGEKRRMINEILSGVIQSLFQAGLIQNTPEELTIELEEIFQKRKASQIIERCQLALNSSDPITRRTATMRLCSYARMEFFNDANEILSRQLGREADPMVKKMIQEFLENVSAYEKQGGITVVEAEKPPEEIDFHALSALDTEGLKKIRPKLPEILKACPREDKIKLLQALGSVGEPNDASLVFPTLQDPDPQILTAAIEALNRLNPQTLITSLPKLIQHPSADVRAASIQAIALVDKKKALSLIEKLVFSNDPTQRELGIFNAGRLDFPSSRDLLLRALQMEGNPDNFQQICAILNANLNEDLFQQVLQLRQSLDPTKGEMVDKLLLEGGRKAFPPRQETAPLPGGKVIRMKKALKEAQTPASGSPVPRAASPAPNQAPSPMPEASQPTPPAPNRAPPPITGQAPPPMPDLDEPAGAAPPPPRAAPVPPPSPTPPVAPLRVPSPHAPTPGPTSPTPSLRLPSHGGETQPAPVKDSGNLKAELESNRFQALPLTRQKELLLTLQDKTAFKEHRNLLKSLKLETLHRGTLLELVNRFGALGNKSDGEFLMPLINHQDPSIAAAAIRAVGGIDLDSLMPILGKLLQNTESKVKVAALKVFLQFDRESAVRNLHSMAKSAKPDMRGNVLGLLPEIEYQAAHPIVCEMLEHESVRDLKIKAGSLIAANPTEEGLALVYKITHNEDGDLTPDLAELWKSTSDSAAPLFGEQSELEKKCRAFISRGIAQETEKASQEKAKAQSDLMSALEKPADQKDKEKEKGKKPQGKVPDISLNFDADPAFLKFSLQAAGVGLLATIMIWFVFLRPGPPTPPPHPTPATHGSGTTPPATTPGGNPEFGEVKEIRGTVMFVDPGGQGISVQDQGTPPTRYYINLKNRTNKKFDRGSSFQGQIKPLRRERKTIIAELISIPER